MTPDKTTTPTRPRWPWALLGLALVWVAIVRIPLILNAEVHLDSDLAVDGLTLLEATQGHWRWHYPGTPHIGIGPVLLSWPQAMIAGASPMTLVSGGLVAYELLIVLTFLLTWRAFGPSAASWGLVPLTFASTGAVWLSGRLTGGHLLTAAWHAGAFLLLVECLARGGIVRVSALGLWCGLGLYLDSMFLFTVLAVVPSGVLGLWGEARAWRGLAATLAFALAILVGVAPREVGRRAEPYDAYGEQFAVLLDAEAIRNHASILAYDCIPRLIVGHRLPGFASEPSPTALGARPGPRRIAPGAVALAILGLVLSGAALVALVAAPAGPRGAEWPQAAARAGLLASALAIVAGFLINRNIFNSDNYRYLVYLLVPWSVGFGLLMSWLARRGRGGIAAAALLALALAGLQTADTARWYAGFGWIDAAGRPVRRFRKDPALAWLRSHPEVDRVFGSYWDVYTLAFLTGGRIKGVPYPIFPDRYPAWSSDLPKRRPRVLVARATDSGPFYLSLAKFQGGRELFHDRGVWIIDWP